MMTGVELTGRVTVRVTKVDDIDGLRTLRTVDDRAPVHGQTSTIVEKQIPKQRALKCYAALGNRSLESIAG